MRFLTNFFGCEGSLLKQTEKSWYPYSNPSTGGPSAKDDRAFAQAALQQPSFSPRSVSQRKPDASGFLCISGLEVLADRVARRSPEGWSPTWTKTREWDPMYSEVLLLGSHRPTDKPCNVALIGRGRRPSFKLLWNRQAGFRPQACGESKRGPHGTWKTSHGRRRAGSVGSFGRHPTAVL